MGRLAVIEMCRFGSRCVFHLLGGLAPTVSSACFQALYCPIENSSITPSPDSIGPGRTYKSGAPVSSLREKEVVQPLQAVAEKEIGKTTDGKAFIVDLNGGTSAELENLPGIGAVLAGRIVSHRASHGDFQRVEDLMLVPGIGEKRFQQLRPFVGVRASTSRMGR